MTRRASATIVAILALSGLTGPAGQAAPATAVERVVVVDASGKPVSGLAAGTFHLWSDGVELPIESVTPDASPFTAIVLLDATATFGSATASRIATGFRDGFASALRPGDRVRVGSIADSVDLRPSFSADRGEILKAVDRAYDRRAEDRYGRSPVWDAVWTAAEALSSEPGRRAIVLVTDGRATGNVHSRIEAEEQVVLANAAASVLGVDAYRMTIPQLGSTAAPTAAVVKPDLALQQLADDSGGVYLTLAGVPVGNRPPIQPADLFARIVAGMQQSYLVRFAGPGDGRYHALQIRVDAAGFSSSIKTQASGSATEVRARRAYFSPKGAGPS